MRILLSTLLLSLLSVAPAQAQFGKILDKADQAQKKIMGNVGDVDPKIGNGLKEALEVGTSAAVDQLSAENGYLNSVYKVLIPTEAKRIIRTVEKLPGFENVEEKLIHQMNAAAELAAKEATPIFIDAIKGITFADAMTILKGNDRAATTYLDKNTRKGLSTTFKPIIQSKLDEVNATKYWASVVNAYNKVPLVRKMNPDLTNHVNTKALDGLFGLIAEKEGGIRSDVDQRTSPLLKEVFSQQD